jgi:hypothetical protein
MTHIRPALPPSKHRISECRKGRHDYADGQHVGAGIMRRVCQTCAYVTIDLTGSELTSDEMIERQTLSELTSAQQ